LSAISTLSNINKISIDKDIPIVHHYVFVHNNRRYTYDRDYIDHGDESITGWLLGLDRNNYIISHETFKIEHDGNIIQKGIFRNYAISKKIVKG
jgi:hypothetical protein